MLKAEAPIAVETGAADVSPCLGEAARGSKASTLDPTASQSSSVSNTESGSAGKRGNSRMLSCNVGNGLPLPFALTIGLDEPPAKLADRPERVDAAEREGDAATVERGEEPPPLEGPREVCKNFGTSLPNNLEERLPLFVVLGVGKYVSACAS
jgi:hypothetical protein